MEREKMSRARSGFFQLTNRIRAVKLEHLPNVQAPMAQGADSTA